MTDHLRFWSFAAALTAVPSLAIAVLVTVAIGGAA